jgi:hypothetical protein
MWRGDLTILDEEIWEIALTGAKIECKLAATDSKVNLGNFQP